MLPAASMLILQMPDLTYYQTALAIMLLGVAAGVEYDLLAYLV